MSNTTGSKQPDDKVKSREKKAFSILEKKSGMKTRLKGLGLSMDGVSHIVACALVGKERHDKIIVAAKDANADNKSAKKRLLNEIKKINGMLDYQNGEITTRKVFFDQHKARPLLRASINKTLSKGKKDRELGKTNPKLKYFDRYCSAFRALFAISGKSPNSRLISDIANLFDLTDKRQTSDTIRKRLQRLS
ncbi:MAG: hypothetical protein JRF56_12350 [Deltaproteobacteria bacterium]|jgi:hypothetical protein|nr:hypothetical protein [Deltaproteobacteria bacterium]